MADMDLLHPRRYPTHEGEKGQVFGGECNRTACRHKRSVFWNIATFGFYCPGCAKSINTPDSEVCFLVTEKPSLETMGQRPA